MSESNQAIDLSHPICNGMPVYPGTPEPKVEQVCSHDLNGFVEHVLQIPTHVGTHLDVPFHILKNGQTIPDFDIQQFYGKAISVPLQENNADLTDIINKKIDKYGKPDFILLHTNWSYKWDSPDYLESFPLPNQATFHFIAQLGIKGIGIDAISVDVVHSESLPNHHEILSQNMIIIENLTNLEKLPNGIFEFFCFPLKITNGDGSPVRAVARIN